MESCHEDVVKESDIHEICVPPPVTLPESTTVTETEALIPNTECGSPRPEMQDSIMYEQRSVYLDVILRKNTNLPIDYFTSWKLGGRKCGVFDSVLCNGSCITCCVCV